MRRSQAVISSHSKQPTIARTGATESSAHLIAFVSPCMICPVEFHYRTLACHRLIASALCPAIDSTYLDIHLFQETLGYAANVLNPMAWYSTVHPTKCPHDLFVYLFDAPSADQSIVLRLPTIKDHHRIIMVLLY